MEKSARLRAFSDRERTADSRDLLQISKIGSARERIAEAQYGEAVLTPPVSPGGVKGMAGRAPGW